VGLLPGSSSLRVPGTHVITAARADVCDSHPGFDAELMHELGWFASIVALLFAVPDWG
jgi:hypothetical protein